MGRVRHRLYGEIQKRFEAAGIVIPLPAQQLHVHSIAADLPDPARMHSFRVDRKEATPPPPQFASKLPLPVPAEDCHRGVDE